MIRLTQFSHGAGCGCKISPKILKEILESELEHGNFPSLIVGNAERDDAAVHDLGDGTCVISTTDFFMPIVDDPFDFGRIASANAISDIYAMGGKPLMAISILGWPISKIEHKHAKSVLEGSRSVCSEAGIPLAGGHSIDSPEPIFGLAVTGVVQREHLKQNSKAKPGDRLYLTKALGVGILATAEKRGKLLDQDVGVAAKQMVLLNEIGQAAAQVDGVNAMTDVTGFGLLGHMEELCSESKVSANIFTKDVQLLSDLDYYIEQGCIPGGTTRNWEGYGDSIMHCSDRDRAIFCDPQTSGGLLVSVAQSSSKEFEKLLLDREMKRFTSPIGEIVEQSGMESLIRLISE